MHREDPKALLKGLQSRLYLYLQMVARVGEREAALSACSVHAPSGATTSAQESSERSAERANYGSERQDPRFLCTLPLIYHDRLGTSFWLSGC